MKYFDALALSLALFPNVAFSQGYTNESEVSLYGLSPPVYPSRAPPFYIAPLFYCC
jgi:beta-glucosidase